MKGRVDKAVRVSFHNHRRGDGLRISAPTVRRGCRGLSGLLLGIIVSASWLQADVCTEARDALQRRDLGTAEKLLKQCLADNPAQLGPYLNLCRSEERRVGKDY